MIQLLHPYMTTGSQYRGSKYSEIQKIPTQFGVFLNNIHAQINALFLFHVFKRRTINILYTWGYYLFTFFYKYNTNITFERLKKNSYEPEEKIAYHHIIQW